MNFLGCRKIDASVPLDPEDAALLLDDEVKVKKDSSGIRKKDRPTDKGVAWLVKTQYVSPINLDPAKQVCFRFSGRSPLIMVSFYPHDNSIHAYHFSKVVF